LFLHSAGGEAGGHGDVVQVVHLPVYRHVDVGLAAELAGGDLAVVVPVQLGWVLRDLALGEAEPPQGPIRFDAVKPLRRPSLVRAAMQRRTGRDEPLLANARSHNLDFR
jgi:hypothetical protein